MAGSAARIGRQGCKGLAESGVQVLAGPPVAHVEDPAKVVEPGGFDIDQQLGLARYLPASGQMAGWACCSHRQARDAQPVGQRDADQHVGNGKLVA